MQPTLYQINNLNPINNSPDLFVIFAHKALIMGQIHLESMEFYAFHGHFEEEQIVGNRFLVDLQIETGMDKPARTDELQDAVNYQEAYRLVKREMKKKSRLLEHIAGRILDAIIGELPGTEKATVTIRKMNPPVGGQMKAVSVTLSREKNE